ncbi:MAG TPA: hypothetical protein VFT45_02105 [Longimicrobium sp.]|nr:hypothetical protein [Longimicrobium sp.]
MNELITDIEVDDETFDLIEKVAKLGERPFALVQATDLHPGEFAQFLQETGRTADPAGLLLLGLSAGRSLRGPKGGEVRAVAADLVSGAAFFAGIVGLQRSIHRRSWVWAGISVLSVFASIPLRMISRLRGRAMSREDNVAGARVTGLGTGGPDIDAVEQVVVDVFEGNDEPADDRRLLGVFPHTIGTTSRSESALPSAAAASPSY